MAKDNNVDGPTLIHRLPTVSASQALEASESSTSQRQSFGLEHLDDLLHGGLCRGRLAEVYGPPGAGKTSLCLQVAAKSLCDGQTVVWVDACSRPAIPQLRQIIGACTGPTTDLQNTETTLSNFHYWATPTLAHLLALLLTTSAFPPKNTALLVIDSFSSLIEIAYPRNTEVRGVFQKNDHQRWLNSRRQAMVGDLASKLCKLAAMYNIAVLVTNNVVTKIHGETQALLRTGIYGLDWEANVSVSICLFRGMYASPKSSGSPQRRHARFASVLKGADSASSSYTGGGCIVAFRINDNGMEELPQLHTMNPIQDFQTIGGNMTKKRPHSDMANSEDEEGSDSEYGWGEEELQLAAEGLVDESHLTNSDLATTESANEA